MEQNPRNSWVMSSFIMCNDPTPRLSFPPLINNKGSWKRMLSLATEGKNAMLNSPTNQSLAGRAGLGQEAGYWRKVHRACRTAQWSLAQGKQSTYPMSTVTSLSPGQWGCGVKTGTLAPSSHLLSGVKVLQSFNISPSPTRDSVFIVSNLFIRVLVFNSQFQISTVFYLIKGKGDT